MLPEKTVHLSDGTVATVRGMSARAALAFFEQMETLTHEQQGAEMIAACTLDADGNRIFANGDAVLDDTSMKDFQKLMAATQDVNGLTPEDDEKNG